MQAFAHNQETQTSPRSAITLFRGVSVKEREAPVGFEPTMADLQSAALATWLRRLKNVTLSHRHDRVNTCDFPHFLCFRAKSSNRTPSHCHFQLGILPSGRPKYGNSISRQKTETGSCTRVPTGCRHEMQDAHPTRASSKKAIAIGPLRRQSGNRRRKRRGGDSNLYGNPGRNGGWARKRCKMRCTFRRFRCDGCRSGRSHCGMADPAR